jgi:hypothetical protein
MPDKDYQRKIDEAGGFVTHMTSDEEVPDFVTSPPPKAADSAVGRVVIELDGEGYVQMWSSFNDNAKLAGVLDNALRRLLGLL